MTGASATSAANNDALRHAKAANIVDRTSMATADGTYKNAWKNYVEWVKTNLNQSQPPFLTHENIAHYFTRVVALKSVKAGTVARYVSALQFYADNEVSEHASNGKGSFTVSCAATDEAKQLCAMRLKSGTGSKKGSDPHKGLKDVLTLPQRRTILQYIYRSWPDWKDASVFFTWGLNVGVRGHSNRNLTLCDLNMSAGYGVEKEGPLSRTLLLIMHKGDVHKDRKDTDQQVGCWRHKHYELCSVFATAAHVVYTLFSKNVSFLHENKNECAAWWDLPLVEWESYSETANSTKQIFKATAIESCKVTHLRTNAVQAAGFEGLQPHQINTLTKHMVEKMFSAYQSIVEKEVSGGGLMERMFFVCKSCSNFKNYFTAILLCQTCKVMAGFSKEDTYYVPRATLEWENRSWSSLTKMLLPNIDNWKAQAASLRGDKSLCARTFLYELLPWFVEVLVQDGIYFIKDFRNHPLSAFLRVSSWNDMMT